MKINGQECRVSKLSSFNAREALTHSPAFDLTQFI
jgi:hypothetical protein